MKIREHEVPVEIGGIPQKAGGESINAHFFSREADLIGSFSQSLTRIYLSMTEVETHQLL
ncbi:MAG: hypothetical protein RQ899_13775 [Pseudomonadales bacterium]|nr:hypothetical protein [Pseudomonadales bacterium]